MIRIGQATGTRRRRVACAGRRTERDPSPFRFRAGRNFVVLTSLTLVMALVGGAPIRAQERGSAVPSVQIVATLLTDHKAFSRPTIDATKIDSVVARRPFTGESTALPVVGAFTATDATRWLQVRLPGRPNGRTAWIDSRATIGSSTPWHIVVDLAGRRVVVYESGRAVRSWPAIVGKASTPTPTGEFFVEEAIVLPAMAGRTVCPRSQRPLKRTAGVRRWSGSDRAARPGQPRRCPGNRGFARLHTPRPRHDALVGVSDRSGRPGNDSGLSGATVDSTPVLRYLTAGESHGKALVVIVEGLPAGLAVLESDIGVELARRRLGYGRGPRMRFEVDEITLVGGIRHGRTLGSPVAIEIANTEWPKWVDEMSPHPGHTEKPLTQPRPGHADLTGMQKYGFVDARDVLERASARETAARVAAGALAKVLLRQSVGCEVLSHVIQMGAARAKTAGPRPEVGDLARVDASEVRCFDGEAETAMIEEIKAAAKDGDSLGGIVEVLAYGVPVGLGSHVHWDRKIDALLAQALMSIQAVKGVEIGDGFEVAGRRGSAAHDPITWDQGAGEYRRESTLAGGTEGGMTTGELLVARVAMKPLATLNRPSLATVDMATKEATVSFKERTDVTAVPAMGVVAETMVALVLANEVTRKFGGDSLAELRRNVTTYAASLRA